MRSPVVAAVAGVVVVLVLGERHFGRTGRARGTRAFHPPTTGAEWGSQVDGDPDTPPLIEAGERDGRW
jgi:hypothetical protein